MSIIGGVTGAIGRLPLAAKVAIPVGGIAATVATIVVLDRRGSFERNNGKSHAEIGADFLARYDKDKNGEIDASEHTKYSGRGSACVETEKTWKNVWVADAPGSTRTATGGHYERKRVTECVTRQEYTDYDTMRQLVSAADTDSSRSVTGAEIAAIAATFDRPGTDGAAPDGKLSGNEIKAFNDAYEGKQVRSWGGTYAT